MKNLRFVVIIVVFLVVISTASFYFFNGHGVDKISKQCIVAVEKKIVRGDSLSPFLIDGQEVVALMGFYDCNEIKRGDVILYDHPGYDEPLIKSIYAISGDKLSLKPNGDKWNILINSGVLKNRDGIEFWLSESGRNMLNLYAGTIPAGAYLILGEDPSGSIDSTKFGLVGKSAILGKVEYENKKNN